ncbi:MAG: calcium-binding protein [Calothrix sp. MO_192.B10]|nr:calcium-binding protein [Calothrix sp. MO_192.B10]
METLSLEELAVYTPSEISAESLSLFYNIIVGTPFDDLLNTTLFDDLVIALEGDDRIFGSFGNDIFVGGAGVDTADYSNLGQAITLEAGGFVNKGPLGGTDRLLEIESIVGAVGQANVIDGSTGTSSTTSLNVNLAKQSLIVNGVPGLGTLKFNVQNFVNVIGTEQGDIIIGDNNNNFLDGRGGNDTVFGLGGNDTVLGGAGNDVIGGGNQTKLSSSIFFYTDGNDIVDGGSGSDILIGGTGFDVLDGGTGFDTADYSHLGQAITLEAVGVVNKGFLGRDQILNMEKIIGAAGKANAIDGSTGTSTTTSLNVNLAQERLTVNGIPGLGSVTFQVENFANVTGTSQDDTIIGDNKNNVLEGGGGNDTVLGLGGNDSLIAGTGFDLLDGGTGFDTADYSNLGQAITLEAVGVVNKGFAGTDLISNIEKIIGAAGKANAIDGSTGTSTTTSLNVNLAQERLTVNGIPGLGSVTFQVQNFVNVTGTSQADSIVGNNKNNLLEGGKGNDSLSGLGGKDTLNGVDPTSVKPGLSEIDILTGGADADKFVVGDTKNPYYVGGGGFYGLNDFAFITDFETGQDKIQLNKSQNYLFGRNFIAVRNFLVPYPLPYEEASSDLLTTGGTLTTGEISEISMVDPGVDSVVNDIIGSGGTYDASTVGAESSLKSSSLIPFPSFDIIAIVADNYNYTDIHFV